MRPAIYVLLGVLLVPTVGLVGDIVTDGKFKSTKSSGAPFDVASDDMVLNLNADMVDGVEGTDIYTKAEVDALVAAAAASARMKRYYVSIAQPHGDSPKGVCGSGYHMATTAEISDPSNLNYATDHPDAEVYPDSEGGPPTNYWGWVRTGWHPYLTDDPSWVGVANCDGWSIDNGDYYGTAISISMRFADPTYGGDFTQVPGTMWYARALACNSGSGVWCIED